MSTDETKTAQPSPKPIGRPSKFSQEIADRILFLLSTTILGLQEVLDQIKAETGEEVSSVSVWRWTEANEEFRSAYSRAREKQADVCFDFAATEAARAREGAIVTTGERGGKVISESRVSDNVERSKLIVSTMYKRAAHLNPKKYSEKVTMSGDPDAPIVVNVKVMGMPEEQPKK